MGIDFSITQLGLSAARGPAKGSPETLRTSGQNGTEVFH